MSEQRENELLRRLLKEVSAAGAAAASISDVVLDREEAHRAAFDRLRSEVEALPMAVAGDPGVVDPIEREVVLSLIDEVAP